MDEYRMQFDKNFEMDEDNGDLQHYRIQIDKLEQKNKEQANTFKKRIAQLEGELYSNRRNTVPTRTQNSSRPAKVQNNLNYQLYQKDLQIRELKAENVKLRQIINNPDKVLIRRPDHFEAITEKEQEIIRLRKTIQELQGKHDGQYLSQQKIKKDNEMLLHEIDQLKIELKKQNKTRFGFNEETMDPQLMEAIRFRKQLEVCRKEIVTLQNVIKERNSEVELWRNRYAQKNNLGLGYTTQLEDLRLELTQFRQKNQSINKVVIRLQNQNEKLVEERDRARISAEQRIPEPSRKFKSEVDKTQNLMRFHQGRQIAMKSFVPGAEKTAVKRTSRYDQFHFSDWESVM